MINQKFTILRNVVFLIAIGLIPFFMFVYQGHEMIDFVPAGTIFFLAVIIFILQTIITISTTFSKTTQFVSPPAKLTNGQTALIVIITFAVASLCYRAFFYKPQTPLYLLQQELQQHTAEP